MRLPDPAAEEEVRALIRRALEQDIGAGDATTRALVPEKTAVSAAIVARGEIVVAGAGVARAVFGEIDPSLQCEVRVPDGDEVRDGETVLSIRGAARPILAAERTALNFLQRMSGIATLTRRFVSVASPYNVSVLDTRKTTPGLRRLEKYAVACGGGVNHRMGLYDRVLIKDNHRHLWSRDAAGGLAEAVRRARKAFPGLPVEVEVESLSELREVLAAGPDWILLDNRTPAEMKRCADACAGRCRLEASGGITLDNIAEVAAAGVDAVSLGCLTHSAPAADLSLEVC